MPKLYRHQARDYRIMSGEVLFNAKKFVVKTGLLELYISEK